MQNNAGIGNRLLNSQTHQPDTTSLLQHFVAKHQMQNSTAGVGGGATVTGSVSTMSSGTLEAPHASRPLTVEDNLRQTLQQQQQQQLLAHLRGNAPAASGDQQLATNLSKQLTLEKTAGSRGGPRPIVKTVRTYFNMDGCLVNWRKSHFPFLCQYATGCHPRMGSWGAHPRPPHYSH